MTLEDIASQSRGKIAMFPIKVHNKWSVVHFRNQILFSLNMFASSSVFSEANSLHTSSIKLSGFFKRSEGLELCLNPDENHFRINFAPNPSSAPILEKPIWVGVKNILWVPKCILFKTLILFRIKCAKCVSCVWHRHLPSPSATHEANFWFSRKRRLHGSAKSRLMWPPARALFHFSFSQDAGAASLLACFFVCCFCFPFFQTQVWSLLCFVILSSCWILFKLDLSKLFHWFL